MLLTALVTTGAQAACPTAQDLGTGIVLTYDDGTVERFSRIDAQRVEVLMLEEDPPLRDEMAFGLYLLRSADVSGGTESDVLSVDYGRALRDLPRPAPGMLKVINVTETFRNGPVDVVETYTGGPIFDHRIGDCTLRAVDIKLRRVEDDVPDAVELIRYFPDLGFGHVWGLADEGEPLETFSVIKIETAT